MTVVNSPSITNGDALVISAHAKVNLCLEVLGKREDGLHEVATVLQTISLADRLRFVPGAQVRLHCPGAPAGPDNLILRAASLLRERTGSRAGCAIDCVKRIPVGGGLGGGSADAAATLLALNEFWSTGLSIEELADLARELGADVPFFLRGGTALATGTGTTLHQLPDTPRHWLVLAPIGDPALNKTGSMYGSLTAAGFTDGTAARRQATAIAGGELDYDRIGSAFSGPARERWPATASAASVLARSSPLAVAVSGSGPSVFALYSSRAVAIAALHSLRAAGTPGQLHRFVSERRLAEGPYTC